LIHFSLRCFQSLVLLAVLGTAVPMSAAEPELVDVRSIDPSIMVDLRYATTRNITGRPIYPANMPALLRPEVAQQLAQAQKSLRTKGFGLKIWDAYRPKSAHEQLWENTLNTDYVADPAGIGSLHCWGVAVDATLVDAKGHDVKMPTDFDDFTLGAMLVYRGKNPDVRRHLHMLQIAMARAGFYGLRTEWWHFISKSWKNYHAVEEPKNVAADAPRRALPVQSSGAQPSNADGMNQH
jgi:zinc D-Ala-D-Ala dipeptidase